MKANEQEKEYKLLVLGDEKSGITSFINTIANDKDDMTGESMKKIMMDGHTITVIDHNHHTQKQNPSHQAENYGNIEGVIFVFAKTDKKSLDHLQDWHAWLEKTYPHLPIIPFIVVGTKSDLKNELQVDKNTAREYAQSIHGTYVEVSSKNGYGMDEFREELAKNLKKLAEEINRPARTLEEMDLSRLRANKKPEPKKEEKPGFFQNLFGRRK